MAQFLLTDIIKELCNKQKPYSVAAEKKLVVFTSQIALKYLRRRYQNISKIIISNNSSLEEIAVEAITPLFVNCHIVNYFENNPEYLKKEAKAQFVLHKIIWHRTEQHITKLIKESDPFFHKIQRSVEYNMLKEGFSKSGYFGIIYIVESRSTVISGNVIGIDEFQSIPFYTFEDKDDLSLKEIFNYLKRETKFFPAVPFNGYIKKLKQLTYTKYQNEFPSLEDGQYVSVMNIKDCVCRGGEAAKEKISTYVRKDKLNPEEGIAFKLAIDKMAADLMNGGISRGLMDYLELETKDNYNKYYEMLDYVKKVMKEFIAKELNK